MKGWGSNPQGDRPDNSGSDRSSANHLDEKLVVRAEHMSKLNLFTGIDDITI